MTPELRDLLTALAWNLRGLALIVRTTARNDGHDEKAADALRVAEDVRDALNEWKAAEDLTGLSDDILDAWNQL